MSEETTTDREAGWAFRRLRARLDTLLPDLARIHTETSPEVLRAYLDQSAGLRLDELIEILAMLRLLARVHPFVVDLEIRHRLRVGGPSCS